MELVKKGRKVILFILISISISPINYLEILQSFHYIKQRKWNYEQY